MFAGNVIKEGLFSLGMYCLLFADWFIEMFIFLHFDGDFIINFTQNLTYLHLFAQLLIPHVRYTLQVNTLSRTSIFAPDGILSKVWIFIMYTHLFSIKC